MFLPCAYRMRSLCDSYRVRSRSLSRTSKRLGELTILEKAEICVCLYDVPTLCIPKSPPHFAPRGNGKRQRAREQTGAMQCCRAEWPRVRPSSALLRRSCEAEIEFLCKEAFLMGMCTCERGGDTRACNVARGLRGKTVLKYLIFCLQIKCLFCILSRICVNAQF